MPARLPLFPLGRVLYPGLVLPLHIFEPRYRRLVRDLMAGDQPGGRVFGVIAIRSGVESAGVPDLHPVGCTAQVQQVDALADGGFDLMTVGARRFDLGEVHRDLPYLSADVTYLPEEVGDRAAAADLTPRVARVFVDYLAELLEVRGGTAALPEELPTDPLLLSHLVSAAAPLDLREQQNLLAAPDAATRLAELRRLLVRERGVLRRLRAVPAPELLHLALSTS